METTGKKYLCFWALIILSLLTVTDTHGQAKPADVRPGHGTAVSSTAFSPDAKYLASADSSGTLIVWDLATKKPRFTITETDEEEYGKPVFSPDGRVLAAVAKKQGGPLVLLPSIIRFWDAATGKPLRSLEGDFKEIDELTFSPDGGMLVAETDFDQTTFWDVATGKQRKPLFAAAGPYAFNPAGTLAAATNNGKTIDDARKSIQIFDLKTGNKVRTMTGLHYVTCLSFDPGGKFIAAIDENTKATEKEGTLHLKVWNASTGQPVNGFPTGVEQEPLGFFSPGPSVIALQIEDQSLAEPAKRTRIGSLYNPATGQKQRDLLINGPVDGLASSLSRDGRFLAIRPGSTALSERLESEIQILDLQAGKEAAHLSGFSSKVTSLEFTGDGRWLIVGYDDSQVIHWEPETGLIMTGMLPKMEDGEKLTAGEAVKLLPGGKSFTVQGHSNIYSATTGEVSDQANMSSLDGPTFNPNGTRALVFGEKEIQIYDVPGFNLKAHFEHGFPSDLYLDVAAAVSPDGTSVAVATDRDISVLNAATGERTKTFPLTGKKITRLEYSPDGKYICAARGGSLSDVASNLPSDVTVLDAATGKTVLRLKVDEPYFQISPDSSLLVTLADDDRMDLTRISDGKQVLESDRYVRHLTEPVYFAFNPKRPLIAVGTEYGIQLFDTQTGMQLRRMK